MTARFFPSGLQSAKKTSSATCLGTPPSIGTRARVPSQTKPPWSTTSRFTATSLVEATERRKPFNPIDRDSGISTRARKISNGCPSQAAL